jgi:hypothetical protein
LVGIAALLAAGVVTIATRGTRTPSLDGTATGASAGSRDIIPLPETSFSPFLNTRADVRFVGSDTCRTCHESHAASFHRTGMGRSMAEVEPDREPPDATYDHPPSNRRYQVQRKGGRLWHRELLLTSGTEDVVLAEFPLKYVVGSGRHSLTYLVEAEGFLVESPVTWYASRQAWGMSPGYDRPEHAGFERAVGEGCLICHAGRADAIDGSLHRMNVIEPVIGCERCHGPGALHVERHADRELGAAAPSDRVDFTIVNPAKLSRELAEAICQQCHLRTSATVVTRGRRPDDYRPGLPLQDFRQDFRIDAADSPMTVVGHVEQMHLSRCFQSSDTFTCLTCHNPHDEPRAADRDQHYRTICLTCHQADACQADPQRRDQAGADSCVVCHMPRSDTEIPHLAFTHHRIAVHDKPPRAETDPDAMHHGRGVLKPFLPPPGHSELDARRSLGLGYLEVANRQKDAALAAHYQRQALEILTAVRDAGLRDPALDTSLARLRFTLQLDGVRSLAAEALSHAGFAGQDRCDALFLLADAEAARGRPAAAAAALRELNSLRRHSQQWLLLADCERTLGHPDAAIEALQTATRINPRLSQVHRHLAEHYRKQGDRDRAAWHERRALP